MKIRQSSSERVYNYVVYFLLSICMILVITPIIHVISGSFSDPLALLQGKVFLWPVETTLFMYETVLKNSSIWPAYLNTIIYTLVFILVSVSLTALGAYPLSRKDFFGRRIFIGIFAFTMFFSGGMVPTYLIVRLLGLLDSMWALILPPAISVYNLIIMRSFFMNTIPDELTEAAQIDGCNDIQLFIKVVLPLSKAVLAVMTLFYGVWQWNQWFSSLLYISDRGKFPLQMIIREILLQGEMSNMSGGTTDSEIIGDGLKYATMVIATLPIMALYPFLQKYFVAGTMIGAVKG